MCRRRGLSRLLRHGPLLYADERFAVGAVEQVEPSGLAGLSEALALLAVDRKVKQHHGTRRVVVPQIVMDLLKVPAVLAGHRIDGNDRRGEEIVAGTNGAVEVRTRIARREVDQPERRVDGRRLPNSRAASAP